MSEVSVVVVTTLLTTWSRLVELASKSAVPLYCARTGCVPVVSVDVVKVAVPSAQRHRATQRKTRRR